VIRREGVFPLGAKEALMWSVEEIESVAAVRDEWDALADRAGAGPFTRPGWFEAWAAAFAAAPVRVLAVREGDRLAGAVPFLARRGALLSPTNWHTPAFGLTAESGAAREALAGALLARRAARVDLALVDAADPALPVLREAAAARGHRVVERVAMRSPYVPLEGDFDAYRETLPRKLRKELGRLGRRLADEGAVEYAFEDGTERLDELLDEGFAVEGSGWKSEAGTAIASRAETRRFYRDVARWAAGRGTLVLAFLRLDGRPLAFDMCIEDAGAIHVLKGGFDVDYRRFGPGTLLTARSIERACSLGLGSYELLGADDEYKRVWTGAVRERVRFQAFSPSPAGRLSHLAWTHGRAVAKRALAEAERRRG
jgi:CelD/BcsL family acetyltransferase involved in cellulose biosynthesis